MITDISLNKAAKIAGTAYLVIFILGLFANFFVFENLVVQGDAETTANNILANESLFRTGIASWIVVLICDIIAAWALYILLKPVNKNLSLLAAWLRLVYSTIFAAAQVNLFFVLMTLSGADYLSVFNTVQQHSLILLFLKGYNYGFLIGLVFFGMHLLALGYLAYKSGYIPKFLGILLIAAAFGYVVDSFANFLLPNYTDYKTIFLILVAVPGIAGEFSFTLWLLLNKSMANKQV